MVVTDVYNHRFHKVFAPNDRIDGITDRDDIFVYEVPVTVADNPDTVVLPVYLREKRWVKISLGGVLSISCVWAGRFFAGK